MGIVDTPYGPAVMAMDDDARSAFLADLIRRFTSDDGTVHPVPQQAVFARRIA